MSELRDSLYSLWVANPLLAIIQVLLLPLGLVAACFTPEYPTWGPIVSLSCVVLWALLFMTYSSFVWLDPRRPRTTARNAP